MSQIEEFEVTIKGARLQSYRGATIKDMVIAVSWDGYGQSFSSPVMELFGERCEYYDDYINAVYEVIGISSLYEAKGKRIRVRREKKGINSCPIIDIGHITEERWLSDYGYTYNN
jgi:hypothetical protein